MSRARILADYVSSGDELAVTTATADAALPKAGGAMTGAITTNSTFDGVDIAARDAIHAPKASPAFTGTPTGITAAHLEAGVLPSDVTGGSGLTALGTVASGTLGSSVVFPSGHIVGAYAVQNHTKTTIADNSTYTWGTFTKQQGSTTKLIYSGVLHGSHQIDCDASGYFVSFESSSLSQVKDRTVAGIDVDVIGSGQTHLNVSGVITACVYAETYTVKWGTDVAASSLFSIWNPDAATQVRFNGARNSVLLIWEVVI